ncbi:MAG TPA: hypothetical protein VK815_09150 [Candidatus Acidoferrales bacterium]|jgi:hypothetical protein|nr:hypothetical protein [Candidatus Acidoferrales bacterium]
MRVILLCFALCLAAGCQSPHADKMMPAGIIDLTNADAYEVLDIYSKLTGLKVVKDPQVKTIQSTSRIVLTTTRPITKPQAIKLLEKALREQAGVVITPLDATSVSASYNAALIVAKPKVAGEK